MRRRLWRITFVLAVVLGAFFTAAWGASMLWHARTADMFNGTSRADVGMWDGRLFMEYRERPIQWIAYGHGVRWSPSAPRMLPRAHVSRTLVTILLPLWIPALACFGVACLARWRGYRRLPGHCPACAYDLSGAAGPRCPECGRALAPAQA